MYLNLKNLISVGALETLGLEVSIRDGVLKMTKGSMVVLKGVRRNNLYYLIGSTVTGHVATSIDSDNDSTRLWHMRLGHTGKKSLQALAKQGLLKGVRTYKLKFCEHCIIRKKTKVKFGTSTHCTEEVLDYVHTNIWGPTKTTFIRGNHYFVTFIDDYSRRCWVYTMKHKGKVLELFVEWKKNLEKSTGKKIKVL